MSDDNLLTRASPFRPSLADDRSFLNADGSLNRANVSDPITPALNAARFVLQPGWDVIVDLRWADDLGFVYLNGTLVANYDISRPTHPIISLRNILSPGLNVLRIYQFDTNPGGQNFWGISYSLGIFDEHGRPAFPNINIELHGPSSRAGIYFDTTYELIQL